MAEQKRGDDAGDHAPKPDTGEKSGAQGPATDGRKQDAPNYDKRKDDGRAIASEDVSSANDE